MIGAPCPEAAGSHGGFRQNEVTLVPNPDLPPPVSAAAAAAAAASSATAPPAAATTNSYPPPSAYVGDLGGKVHGRPINVKFVIHGWVMALGWGFFVPAGVWAVRYARAPDDAPPAKNAFVKSLRSQWWGRIATRSYTP
jgi:hypothetical protein